MADISYTAGDVLTASNAVTKSVTAGAAVTAGQPVYSDAGDSGEHKPADADAEATAAAVGIALNDAADGQPLAIIIGGNLSYGGGLTAGEVYVVSTTAGGVAPIGDLAAGDFVTVLGVATTASNLKIGTSILVSGAAK